MTERQFSRHLAQELEQLIEQEGPETVAPFFAGPVMGAGGLIAPPEGYFEEIVPVLRRHDVLLVLDEVVSGFGRLGAYWGSQVFKLEPDLITAAKGITSGYFPMSACLVSPRIWRVRMLFDRGLIARPLGDALVFAPPLVIERNEIDELIAKFKAGVESIEKEIL
jgi:L-2,4-diaminobutyrate transaminase